MSAQKFNTFKKKAVKFKVQDNHLFCQNCKNLPIRQLVDDLTGEQIMLQQLHDESGHKKREGPYRRVVD